MKYSNTIEYNISTKLDSSGLTKLQSQIKQLENSMQQMANHNRDFLNLDKVQAAKTQLEGLNKALTNSFNSSLGILDLSKFRAELDSSGVSATELQSAFGMMGAEGQAALNGLTTQIANFNGGMERTSSTVDKIFTTFSNTFRWGLVSSFFSQFMNAIHSSVNYVKELDNSLTQIMLVTDYNRDSMNQFAKSANEAAKAVSMTTTSMTNASLIFAQQGYGLGQSQELATLSAKLANASQQDTATTSDQITAYMNAYGLENSIGELTQAMDNWALIANISAADVSELAQASQRAASMANTVGVSGEQLAAQIATIESVTREAPEQIGNGLKTLYARFSDISNGGEDEEGVSLGDVTEQLNAIGVRVLDQFGNIRDVGDIMEDLMVIWDDLDQTSKIAAAQSLAGKYQVNRFVSLMDNSDMYKEYLGATGSSAAGTLDQMNEEYAQSIEGRSAKLQASLEGLFSTVFNTDDIYPWIDAAQSAVDLLQQFFDALGGGKTVLLGITTLLTQAFSQNIARSINDMIANRNLGKIREQNINEVKDTLDRVGINRDQGVGAYISKTADQARLGALNNAQYDAYMNDVQQWVNTSTALAKSEQELQSNIDLINAIYAKAGMQDGAFKESKDSPYNTTFLQEGRAEVLEKLDNLDFSSQEQAAARYAETLRQISVVFKEVKEDTSDEGQKQDELAIKIQGAREALSDFTKILGMSKEVTGQWDQEFENIVADLAAMPENSVEAEKALSSLYGRVAELRKNLFNANENKETTKKFVAGATDRIQGLETQVSFNEAQDKRAEENATARGKSVDDQLNIKQVLDTFNAIQQLTFAWQAFQNLGSIWSNTDLTDGEKVLQTIMNLSMAIPQLITGFGQLGTSIKSIGSFLQDSYFSALKEAAKAELENAQAVEAKQKQQKDAIEAEMAALRAQQEKIKNDQDEIQGEIFLTQLEVERNQARVDSIAILDQYNKQALAAAKGELEIARSLAVEAQAQQNLNQIKLNGLKQEYNAKEASGKLGNKERARYRAAIAEGELLSESDKAQTMDANNLVTEAEQRVQLAQERETVTSTALTEARERLTDSTNRLAAAEEKFKSNREKLQEIESKMNSIVSGSLSVLADFKNAQETVSAATEKYAKIIGAADEKTLTLGTAIKGLPTAFSALASSIGLTSAGLGIFIGVAAAAAALIGGIIWGINKEAEEQKAQAEALAEINQRIAETANTTKESTAEWLSLKNTFKETGEASDEFVDALLKQAEAYGINDAAVDIAKGHYEELIAKIDEARNAALESEKVLSAQQLQENAKNPADAFKNDLNLEDIGITKHGEVESFNLSGTDTGTQGRRWTEVYDQSPYEQYQLIKDAIAKSKEEVDSLRQKWDQAIDDGDKAAAASYKRQADAVSAHVHELEGKLEEFSYLADSVKNLEEDSLLARASVDEDTTKIFSEGNFEEVKAKIKETLESDEDLKKSIGEIDDSTVEELAASMMQLYENTKLAGEAAEKTGLSLSEYFNQDKIGTILEDAGLVDKNAEDSEINAAFQKYVERFKEMGGAGINKDQVNTVREEIDDLNASLEEETKILGNLDKQSNAYKNQERKVASLTNQLENSQTQLEQLAAAALETSNGMDELSEKWTDINDAISNSSSAGELTQTYSELQGILSKILNVDPSMITQDFMESADVLAALGDLANGDTEAIWRLREAFGDGDLVLNAYLDTIGFEGDRDKLFALVNEAQAALPNLEVGAHLEDEEFLNALTEMVLNSQLAAEDVQRIFNGLGYDVEIQNNPMTFTGIRGVVQTAGQVAGAALSAVNPALGSAISNAITSVSYEAGDSVTVDVPSFTFTKKGGGTGGHTFRNNTGGGSGGGGKGSCFVAGTLITTQTSFKPIEQIQKGDIVLSYNEQIGFNQYSKVVQTMIHDTIEPIYTLHIKNEQLRVTGIHRFFVIDKITCGIPQWVCAADLHVGQWVLFADGTWHVIHKIEINIEHQTVYNFEVSGNHNYYVGHNQILAHNKGGGSGGKGSTPKTIEPKEKKDHEKDYYEEVENQLSKTEKVLSKIEKEEDRLIGDEARANQNRQIKFLEKEIKLNEKKLKINKQELKDVDDKIKKEIELAKAQAGQYGVNANIPEIKYDEDGVISNYEEISAAIDRIHNELIDKYNAAAAASNEELTKEIQKAIDKFDKYGDNVLKNAQRHNALQSEIEETKNTLEELQDAIEDIRIEAKHAAMEAIDDIKDLNKSMAELDGFFSGFKLDSAKRDLTELGSELDSVFNNDNAVNYYNNLIAEQDKMIEKAKEAVKTAKDAEEKEKAQALLESRTLTRNALIEQRDRAQNALNSGQEWKGGILGLQQQHVEDLTKRLEAFNNAELNGKEYVDPIFGKNKAALMEYLEEARSGLADTLIQVEELVEDFRSSLIDLYDESADKQQKLQDEFDRQTEKLETRMDWYTLYYGDEAYDAMNQFYTKEGELLAAQSRRRKADADFWYAEAEKLRIKSQQQGIELDKEQYDHLLDLAKEAESESEELATKSAEAFKDAFDKAIDAVGQKFYRTIFSNINRDVNGAPEAFANSVFNNNRIYDTSYLGITDNNGNPITQASLTDFNDIKTKWELQKEYSSKYRDNMERSYEIDKLRAKYMDILNNAQNMSLQTQNKIRAQMQDQLDYLKGQTTLSEYDVKLANARLEILQKQIALEEAQRNKNKMQLRRDTQGNYRYVYTADKGDTDKAQQELDDSLFDAYEITKEQSLQNVDSLLSSLQNYMEQRSEILRRYSANDAETAQKRAAALAMLDEEYKQIWTALGEDFSDTMQGLDEVLTWTIENGNANTVEAASEMLDAVNNHNYDILGEMNASWIGWSDDMRFNVLPAISEATQEAMVESEVAVRDFAEHLVGPEGILPELNSGINSYKDILDKTKQSTNELAKASEELATALNADSIEFQKKTEQLLGYQQELNNTKNTTSKLRDELNKARELLEKEKKKTAALTQGIKDIAAGTAVAGADGSVKGKSTPGGSGTKNTGKWHVGDRVGFHGWYNYTSWGQEPAGNLWSDQKNAVVISDFSDTSVGGTQSTGEYTIHLETPQGGWLGWVRPDQLFDTGGYTGQWSDGDKNAKNGKWAMLHEKELVLNANDTENILQAVNMLRKFTNALGISKLSLNGLTTNQGQIEQRVEINASFPNVHSAEDVEAALLEIADQAYIYAHKD